MFLWHTKHNIGGMFQKIKRKLNVFMILKRRMKSLKTNFMQII